MRRGKGREAKGREGRRGKSNRQLQLGRVARRDQVDKTILLNIAVQTNCAEGSTARHTSQYDTTRLDTIQYTTTQCSAK
jgi:hypothetical protein